MPVKPVRRIAAPTGPDLYDMIAREALSCAWSRDEVARTEAQHPELIVDRDGNLLVGLEGGALAYAFRSDGSFIEHFEPMFEQLLPRLRRAMPAVATLRFRLAHNPSRMTVEPILRRLWFAPRRSWLLFSLERATRLPRAGAIAGVKFRDGSLADLDDIVRIDDECFPQTPRGVLAVRASIDTERLLVADVKGRPVAFALYRSAGDEGGGYLSVLAVSEEARGRGIGEALTVRVAKKLFAEGAQRLDLRTDDDNAEAIRLYVRLGFRQTQAGRDYTRPADPNVVAKLKKDNEGTLIRFGGWR